MWWIRIVRSDTGSFGRTRKSRRWLVRIASPFTLIAPTERIWSFLTSRPVVSQSMLTSSSPS